MPLSFNVFLWKCGFTSCSEFWLSLSRLLVEHSFRGPGPVVLLEVQTMGSGAAEGGCLCTFPKLLKFLWRELVIVIFASCMIPVDQRKLLSDFSHGEKHKGYGNFITQFREIRGVWTPAGLHEPPLPPLSWLRLLASIPRPLSQPYAGTREVCLRSSKIPHPHTVPSAPSD